MIENRKLGKAVAWVRKYFVAASVDRGFDLLSISGIMARRFISRPTHIMKRLVLRIVTMGPVKTVK